jgi:hypothetical protein
LTVEDLEAQHAGLEIDPSDFDGPLDIVPVSDPQIFSETQRFAQVQALLQRSAMLPQLYDQRKVEELFLRTMKISNDEVLQPKADSENMDPVSENVAASMGRPVYVLPKQDHIAHIMTHLTFLKSPLFGQNPAIIKTFLYPMAIHLRDHLLNYYLTEAHEAIGKATKEDVISDDANQQAQLILEVQHIIEQQLGGFSQELAQIDQQAQQFRPQPQLPTDNSMQIAQLNAQIQGQALQQRAQADQAKLQQDAQLKQAQLSQNAQQHQEDMAAKQQDNQLKLQEAQLREQAENQRQMADLVVRERMNTADNTTAMQLAQAEIMSGEKIAVSTGTGINPGTR